MTTWNSFGAWWAAPWREAAVSRSCPSATAGKRPGSASAGRTRPGSRARTASATERLAVPHQEVPNDPRSTLHPVLVSWVYNDRDDESNASIFAGRNDSPQGPAHPHPLQVPTFSTSIDTTRHRGPIQRPQRGIPYFRCLAAKAASPPSNTSSTDFFTGLAEHEKNPAAPKLQTVPSESMCTTRSASVSTTRFAL